VLDHIVRELAVIHNRAKQRGFSGEDARAIAAQLRTAAVRSTQIGIDASAKEGVHVLIRNRGRQAVLSLEIDRAKTKAHMKRYGIDVDERWLAAGAVDEATRRKALDALTNDGVTGVLTHTAGVFEKIGSALDARAGSFARVRYAQSDPLVWLICTELLSEIAMIFVQLGPICEASAIVPGLDIVCAALEASLSAYFAMYWVLCGGF